MQTPSQRLAAFRPSRTLLLLALCAVVLTVSTGIRQSLGLFLQPMTVLGISVSAFSFAIALQSIVWGMSQPLVGMLADRYGAQPVLIGSALVYAAGLAIVALTGSALGLDIGGGVMAGIGVAGTNLGVLMGVAARAVPRERQSQTVGAVAAAGSLGTMALAPLGQWLIDGFGWRAALAAFAGFAVAMAFLSYAVGRQSAAAGTAAPGEAADERSLTHVLRQAGTHPGYLAMTAAFFACGFQLMFITVHLPSYLAICGLSPSLGATAIGVIGLCNAVGTYCFGLLGARFQQRRLLALIYLLRTLSIIAFLALPVSPASTIMFAAAMGFLWLSVAPLVSGLIGRVFGLKYFSTLYGFVFLSHQVGSFFGVMLGGLTYDLTGSYDVAWGWLIGIGLLAFALQWPMDDRTPAEREAAAGLRAAARA